MKDDIQFKKEEWSTFVPVLAKGGAGGGQLGKSDLNTSDLAGGKGGLGEAKIINIKIDTMQKIDIPGGNGRDVISQSGTALELLLRGLNNIIYSQGTM